MQIAKANNDPKKDLEVEHDLNQIIANFNKNDETIPLKKGIFFSYSNYFVLNLNLKPILETCSNQTQLEFNKTSNKDELIDKASSKLINKGNEEKEKFGKKHMMPMASYSSSDEDDEEGGEEENRENNFIYSERNLLREDDNDTESFYDAIDQAGSEHSIEHTIQP